MQKQMHKVLKPLFILRMNQTVVPLAPESREGRPGEPTQSKALAKATRSLMASTLYSRYPRHQAKAHGLKAIEKAIIAVAKTQFAGDERAAADWLGERVDQYARSPQGSRPEKDLIPLPATWFNGAQYEDDSEEWKHAGTRNVFGGRQQIPVVAQRPPGERLNEQLGRYRAQHPAPAEVRP